MFVEGGARARGSGEAVEAILTDAPTDWLEREIGELAAHIAAATCRWLELVAEFDRRRAHETWGFHSCGAWVAWRCAIDRALPENTCGSAIALQGLQAVRSASGAAS